ncbi:MAG: HAMP domain-containing histidine kinase [Clostridiales bacterium]|nr:HAMP domain-containing histidine kinase [Clostridiales bacterium]
MRKYYLKYLVAFLLFVVLGVGAFFAVTKIYEGDSGRRNTLANRFVQQVEEYPSDDLGEAVEAVRSEQESSWASEFGERNVPSDISYISIDEAVTNLLSDDTSSSLTWIISRDGKAEGIVVFTYEDLREVHTLYLAEAVVVFAFIILITFFIYIDRKVIMPFNKLSSYPEKIAKNETGEHIPESKERYFGKYIWGMNMLSDRLSGDRKKLRALEKEKQTLLSSIAHGIKTPVANIRLYAQALKSGLYRKEGIPDPDDAMVAEKIEKNTQDIEDIVKELLNAASKSIVEYEPSIDQFYLSEIEDWLKEEYSNRMNVLKIPFTIDCKSRVMINSDKSGVIRVLTQFIENAIKYSDGKHIGVIIDKSDEGYEFVVGNTGSHVPENEEKYVFNSFYRGSNSENVEGNGLGLYEASFIARKLGGTVATRYNDQTSETEFCLFFPL